MLARVTSLLGPLGLLGLALLAASAGPIPGDYHEGETLNCAECHVMHTGEPPPSVYLQAGRGSGRVGPLLKEDVNDLCLSCHDGTPGVADVLGLDGGRGVLRQGGFLNRLGRSGLPATGHTLGSTETAPGSVPPWSADLENANGGGLDCLDCHAHHGGSKGASPYRNLRDDAGYNRPGQGLVTYNDGRPGANDPTRDVFQRRERGYDEADVDFNEPDSSDSAMARFCAGCHSRQHGKPGSANVGGVAGGGLVARFSRHPTAGIDLGSGSGARSSLSRFASLSNRVKVMSEVGVWDPPGRDVTPTCITCHKAHGNANAFGLILRSGTGVPTENGDTGGGQLEDLCGQCHAAPSS